MLFNSVFSDEPHTTSLVMQFPFQGMGGIKANNIQNMRTGFLENTWLWQSNNCTDVDRECKLST